MENVDYSRGRWTGVRLKKEAAEPAFQVLRRLPATKRGSLHTALRSRQAIVIDLLFISGQ